MTADRLRTDVSDVVGFLTNRATFSAIQSNGLNQSIPDATWTAITLDNAIFDNAGGHSNTTNPSRYVCQVPGWYLALGGVCFSSSATGSANDYIAGIRVNGSNSFGSLFECGKVAAANSSLVTPTVVELVNLNAGDYVELAAWQSSGTSITLTSSTSGTPVVQHAPYLTLTWACNQTGSLGISAPSPITWVNGTSQINQATLNAQIRDIAGFLTYPPAARLYYNGTTPSGQTVPNNTSYPVKWDSAALDTFAGWAGTGTNATRWTAPVAGRYLCVGYNAMVANQTGKRGVGLRVNGTTMFWGQQTKPTTGASHDAGNSTLVARHLRLNQGDYVEVIALQTTGTAMSITTGTSCSRFITVWMGS